MTVNISEEQKQLIESQGLMVIEFKMWVIKTAKVITDVMKAIIEWFVDLMTVHVIPALCDAFNRVYEAAEDFFCLNGHEKIEGVPKYMHQKHRAPKAFTMYYAKIWRRARSNC